MKKFFKILLIIIVILVIICGAYFVIINSTKKSALDTIDIIFTALKAGNDEIVSEYINTEDFTNNETEGETENIAENEEMSKIMVEKLTYEVISIDTKINQCTVKLKVSNKDLKTVFGNYITKVLSLAFSQAFEQITEEEVDKQLNEYFIQQYNSEDIQTLTNELTINMKKENGKWNLSYDNEELVNAIFPGYSEIIESFKNNEE